MTATFCLAKAEHVSEIRKLFFRSLAPIGERLGTGTPASAFSNLNDFFQQRNLYVLKQDGTILGAAALHEADGGLYIDYLAVHVNHQGKRLGSRLLAELELLAESRELTQLQLHTPEVMDKLLSFYLSRGFHETGRALPPHGRDSVLRVYFAKRISGSDHHMDEEHEHDRLVS